MNTATKKPYSSPVIQIVFIQQRVGVLGTSGEGYVVNKGSKNDGYEYDLGW